MLRIENIHAQVENTEVLKGINLNIKAGEVHAIMGPNGSGKSTLSKVIAGHPSYKITSGQIYYEINFKEKDLTELNVEQRAREGIFLSFQYPIEIPGLSNFVFLQSTFNSICKFQGVEELDEEAFRVFVKEKMKLVEVDEDFLDRFVNVGFSGGEKKRNEILQMAVLNPRLAFLDEMDSGLDIDALRIVANGVNNLRRKDNAIVLITHYQRLLNYIQPDYVHVLSEGRMIKTGTKDLALEIEKNGYDWILKETGL